MSRRSTEGALTLEDDNRLSRNGLASADVPRKYGRRLRGGLPRPTRESNDLPVIALCLMWTLRLRA
jgi:hypothetical protein